MEIKVLDHGFVRLVEHMGNDDSIVRSARVSYGEGTKTKRDDEKLIRYLIKHKHTSPLESVQFTFHVSVPIFIARQWHRHRSWSYNEVSGRYSKLSNNFYIPEYSRIQAQDGKNRQASAEQLDPETQYLAVKSIRRACEDAYRVYENLLDSGVSREIARIILPLNTYTEFYASVNLHNLFHFLGLRLENGAQSEIREYSKAIVDIIREIVPVSVRAWEELVLNESSSTLR